MFYRWAIALHLFGVLLWFAGALIALHVLRVHERASRAKEGAGSAAPGAPPSSFAQLEGAAGRILDAGSGLAIAAGLYLLISNLGILKGAGFMHAKLTLVLLLIGVHGFLRAQLKRFRTGQANRLPAWPEPVVLGLFFAIVVLIIVRPF